MGVVREREGERERERERETERGDIGARDKRGGRGEASEESNRRSISRLSSQQRFDKHIEFELNLLIETRLRTQFAYRSVVANSNLVCVLFDRHRFSIISRGGLRNYRKSMTGAAVSEKRGASHRGFRGRNPLCDALRFSETSAPVIDFL